MYLIACLNIALDLFNLRPCWLMYQINPLTLSPQSRGGCDRDIFSLWLISTM